jgi:hypothetical protein
MCDPAVSFDAERVLFAGRKSANDRWRIWQVKVDGSDLRPVSPESMDSRSGIYVSTLFTLDSPEPWYTAVFVGREPFIGENGVPESSSLYNVKLDGTELRRMTFNPGHNFDPVQMWDGRVIYSAERYSVEPASESRGRVRLYAIHVEGADVEFYGGGAGARVQHMPCSTQGGLLVFVEAQRGAYDGAGQLACVTERRPHVEYRQLTHDKTQLFLYPTVLSENALLVARRPADSSGTCGVYLFDADTRKIDLVYDSTQFHDVQAKPLRPRKSPDGHSTVVESRFKTGTFYGLNCYDTDKARTGHLKAGMVKRVRFIEGVQRTVGKATVPFTPTVPRRLIGEAPVEADGSFNVEVPSDTPMLLQTLDDKGMALGNCGWIWVKSRETRGCIGCHEDPERIPENEYALALRRPSTRLVLSPEQRRVVAFATEIAPLFAASCATADCHGATNSKLHLPLGDLSNQANLRQAYANLMTPARDNSQVRPAEGKYIDPGRARTSPLLWQLFGEDTSRPWDKQTGLTKAPKIVQMPPHSSTLLRDYELRTIIQWVDMGAQFESLAGSNGIVQADQQLNK